MSDSTVPQPNEEQLIRSAEIILFRPRAAPPTTVPGQSPVDAVSEPQQRLVRALDALNAAMAAQRDAMAQWRASLAEASEGSVFSACSTSFKRAASVYPGCCLMGNVRQLSVVHVCIAVEIGPKRPKNKGFLKRH